MTKLIKKFLKASVPLDLTAIYQQALNWKQLAAFEVHQRFYEIGSIKGIQEFTDYISKQTGNYRWKESLSM